MRVISGTAPVPICPLHRCGATSPGTGPHRTAAGCELVKTWSRAATNLLMVPPSTLCIFLNTLQEQNGESANRSFGARFSDEASTSPAGAHRRSRP